MVAAKGMVLTVGAKVLECCRGVQFGAGTSLIRFNHQVSSTDLGQNEPQMHIPVSEEHSTKYKTLTQAQQKSQTNLPRQGPSALWTNLGKVPGPQEQKPQPQNQAQPPASPGHVFLSKAWIFSFPTVGSAKLYCIPNPNSSNP